MVPIIHYLPEIYQSFFPDFFQSSIPEEKLATCEDCAMFNKGEGIADNNDLFFSKETKCCTYYPSVPNYLVGGILTSSDPGMKNGKENLANIIAKRIDLYPIGIVPPQKYRNNFKKNKEHSFGRDHTLLCPFFNSNSTNCSIWRFRSNVCSTWFCKHVKGKDGKGFWNTICDYLKEVERNISEYVLLELGYESGFIKYLYQSDSICEDKSDYKNRWLHWHGREEEFYQQAFSLVKQLRSKDFQEIMKPQDSILHERLRKTRETMLFPTLPSILKRNPELTIYCQEDKYQIINDTCNVVISKNLYNILKLFDGSKDTCSINNILRQNNSCFLNNSLLIKLYQNQILI